MDQFYIVLPSNVRVEGNKTSNFTVRLPNTIDLSEGDWYMALSSIIYPVAFNLGKEDQMRVGLSYYKTWYEAKYTYLPEVTFESIEQLERNVNETLLGSTIKPRKRRNLSEEEPEEEEEREKRASNLPQNTLAAVTRESYQISLGLQKAFSSIEEQYNEATGLKDQISATVTGKESQLHQIKNELLEEINNIISLRNSLRSDLIQVMELKKQVDKETDLEAAKDKVGAIRTLRNNILDEKMEGNHTKIKRAVDSFYNNYNNKFLNQTIAQEIKVNTYKKLQELQTTIDDKILEVEGTTARIENKSMQVDQLISNLTDIDETNDFKERINEIKSAADLNRSQARTKRFSISSSEGQYQSIIERMAKSDIDAEKAKEFKSKAKWVIDEINKDINFVDDKLQKANNYLEQVDDEIEELNLALKPVDEGMQRNIKRVKEEIIKKFSEEQLNNLEIYFYYDHNLGRFFLYNHKPKEIKWVSLSARLAYILGFDIDKSPEHKIKGIRMRKGGGFARGTPDISSGIHQLYVYMPNIIDYTYVGDKQSPLLRVVNIDKPINTIAESIYTNLHYIKVVEKRISSIKIEIRDLSGNLINFNWGNVIVTLAVKRAFF